MRKLKRRGLVLEKAELVRLLGKNQVVASDDPTIIYTDMQRLKDLTSNTILPPTAATLKRQKREDHFGV
jgi:hypothetical protein